MPERLLRQSTWDRFESELSTAWLNHGFRRVQASRPSGKFVRELAETVQLVEYDVEISDNDRAIFTIELAIWSRRLMKARRQDIHKLTARNGHWWHGLSNLMPTESSNLWWTVTADHIQPDVAFHSRLAESTIMPIFDKLMSDAALVEVWRTGGTMGGLSPFPQRAANAVFLAGALGGSNHAAEVARDMVAIAERSASNRPEQIAKLRKLVESLPVSSEFLDSITDSDLN